MRAHPIAALILTASYNYLDGENFVGGISNCVPPRWPRRPRNEVYVWFRIFGDKSSARRRKQVRECS